MSYEDERIITDTELSHYGTPRRSGRYPWGSGENPMQSGRDLIGQDDELRRQGLTEKQRAKAFGFETTTQLRAMRRIAVTEKRQSDAAQALRLSNKGLSNVAIGQRMGIPESSVRNLINPALAERRNILDNTANFLKKDLDENGGFLDIGSGSERWIGSGVSKQTLSTAVAMLKAKGYVVENIQQPQMFGKGNTTIQVLAPPGTKWADIARNKDQIRTAGAFTEDGGRTFKKILPPVPVSPDRVSVRHGGEGGELADGVVYIRPGVPDIALGGARYMQVRIAVGDNHFIKGMAMYKDDLPDGVDLQFNTSARNTGNKMDALKPIKGDEERPFGSVIRQYEYSDSAGKKHLSPINVVNEEGDWQDWRSALSSQVLSKQSTTLAKRQLDLELTGKTEELNGILRLTNPVVRKKMLKMYADSADSDAVHMRAAHMPGQGTHVILPLPSLKPTEIYAPKYESGTTVALIRHPHGGIFEIPELKVNNRNPEGRKYLGPGKERGPAIDAVGIHPSVAKRLSGADFDGDAVLVIPNDRRALKTAPALAGLKNFDAIQMYGPYDGMRTIDGGTYNAKTRQVDFPPGKKASGRAKQQKMGDVSNLITDMTIKNASHDEIAAAVRHSMVVIDAEKHHLDVDRSYRENGIAALKRRYQTRPDMPASNRLPGASTLISRAGSQKRIPQRRPRPASKGGPIDPVTGRKMYEETGRTIINKQGIRVLKRERTTQLAEIEDARLLSSGTAMENVYASHSNALKALANRARLAYLRTGNLKYSPAAAKAYAGEVKSLNAKLDDALRKRPFERQAQIAAATRVRVITRENELDADAIKKLKVQSLELARTRLDSKKPLIEITDKEWEAIQSGAISSHKLDQILDNAKADRVKELATPRQPRVMTSAQMARARAILSAGYTQAEVAARLGIPVSTLNSALLREGGG